MVSFAGLGLTSAKPLGIVLGAAGAVLLLTAVTGSCPLCRLSGINTAR